MINVKTYLLDSNVIYKMIDGQYQNILSDHIKGKILLIASSLVLTDQFNNEPGWQQAKKDILNFIKSNNIKMMNVPDRLWHKAIEPKSLPGPAVMGSFTLASKIWVDSNSGGIMDIIAQKMFNNFKDIQKRSSLNESERKRYYGCLNDIYLVICAIENKVEFIISTDKDVIRIKDFLKDDYNITIIKPGDY